MIKLRPYQEAAVDNTIKFLLENRGMNPIVALPTGTGKSVIAPEIIRRCEDIKPGTRFLVATHVKELIEQNYGKLKSMLPPDLARSCGMFSASLNRKEGSAKILVGGVQSLVNSMGKIGRRDIVIIDECHLVPHSGNGRYRTMLEALKTRNPRLRVIGLTATEFRTSGGYLTQGDGKIFHAVSHKETVGDMLAQGWLAPLVTPSVAASYSTDGVKTRGGDYVMSSLGAAIKAQTSVTERAVEEMCQLAKDRKSWLIFAANVTHAEEVLEALSARGIDNLALVTGNSRAKARRMAVDNIRNGTLRGIVNVGVYTTGFDAPNIDFIGVLRPTKSPGLWVQICGRGMRTHPGKKDCLVADFGGNVDRHGPLEAIEPPVKRKGAGEAPMRVCPECKFEMPAGNRACPSCGKLFDRDASTHEDRANRGGSIVYVEPRTEPVVRVSYSEHVKRDDPTKKSLRVSYYSHGGVKICDEYIMVGRPANEMGAKAHKWVERRLPEGVFVPVTPQGVVDIAHMMRAPSAITIVKRGKFWRVVGYDFEENSCISSEKMAENAQEEDNDIHGNASARGDLRGDREEGSQRSDPGSSRKRKDDYFAAIYGVRRSV